MNCNEDKQRKPHDNEEKNWPTEAKKSTNEYEENDGEESNRSDNVKDEEQEEEAG